MGFLDAPSRATAAVTAQVNAQVPPLVASSIASDPSVANAAANMAQSTAGLVPVWKASTAYTAGQRVIAPNGDVVSAKVAFTSSATYSATNWNASTQDGRIAGAESRNATQDGRIDGHDSQLATITNDYSRRADPGMPGVQADDATYVEVVTDAAGQVARGTLADGTQHLPSAKIDRGNLAGEIAQQVDSAAYYRATVDATGLVAEPMAIGPDGCTPMWVLERWAQRMAPLIAPAIGLVPYSKIAAFGDSMTNGYLGGGPTYPIALASALGVEVQNFGIPSQTSHEIALRQGGLQLALTVTGNSIPASGPVAVTAYTPTGTWRSGFAWSFTGSLAGVDGTLSKATDNTWSFTRATAGTATACPAGTVFVAATEKPYDSWIQILWSGRNNVDAATVKADTDAMVANLTPQNKQFLILSVCNGQNEPSGSAGYNSVATVNAALQTAYPNNYVDVRAWLISSGLAAAGITATAADNTAISEDRIPPSLMVDNLHLTGTGYTIIGTYLASVIRAKGYIK